jgi:hypothetical protein
MKPDLIRIFLVALTISLASTTHCDRGGIVLGNKIDIEEASQNAIILWNGKIQKTILTTNLSAKENVEIVEIMPFPTRPSVEKADYQIFIRLKEIIDKEYEKQKNSVEKSRARMGRDGEAPKNIQFLERKQIGQSDVTVLRINAPNGIKKSLNQYLVGIGAKDVRIDEGLAKVIRAYVKDGYAWFVVNKIQIGPEPISNEAISYSFETRKGFYPLKISNTKQGTTSINLMIFTPNFVIEKSDKGWQNIERMFAPRIDSASLYKLSKDEFTLLADAEAIFLTIWNVTGDIKKFDNDVIFNSKNLYRRDGKKVGTKPFYNEEEYLAK